MVSSWVEGKEGVAEHLVYLNKEGKELQKLLAGEKNAIIRGAAGRKSPLGGRAKVGDRVYFVETGGGRIVTHRGLIENVTETEKMTPEESQRFVEQHQSELNLSKKQMERWAGKKFLAIYRIAKLEAIEPFTYQRGKNMDDWVITSNIEEIK